MATKAPSPVTPTPLPGTIPGQSLAQKIDQIFTYHAPAGDQPGRYVAIRDKAKEMAQVIIANTPACADQTTAIRHLRDCVMTANAAIALNGLV